MLKQRVITALILLPIMLLMLFCAGTTLWAIFAALIVLLALWEYSRMCAFSLKQQMVYLSTTALFMLMALAGNWTLPAFVWLAVLAFWLIIMPIWLYQKWQLQGALVRNSAIGLIMLLPFWFALMLLHPENGSILPLLRIMVLVWIADSAAYFTGKRYGKHKLAANISPKKSWEGALGGLIAVLIYMTFFQSHDGSWIMTMILSTILTALSIGGDLLESWLKRSAGVKDSSQLLPGHGGVFDRIDGLIAVISVYAALQVLSN